jgi:hypothetical protein
MQMLKILRGIVAIVGFAILVLLIAVIGFLHFNPLCGEEVVQELRSPDGRYVAISMERNCGATTGYVEHVNLRAANKKLSSDFFNGTIRDGEVFVFEQRGGDTSPRFAWSSNQTLKIENTCDERTWKSDVWRDVSIDYSDSTCRARTSHDAKVKK